MAGSGKTEDESDEQLDPERVPAAEGLDDEDDDADGDAEALDVPASAAGKASAVRLIELLVEKKAMALHKAKPGAKLIESVGRILESPLPLKARATQLSDAIVDSPDVDELFIDDETLIELLKRW